MLSSMNKFKAALVDTEAVLRNRLVSSLNSIMQSIWPELYPYQDYVSLKIEARKDDYLMQACMSVNGADSWQPLDAVASGGERSVACLAMRIALSMVIVPNLRWIILDEPTHNIDSNGIGKLVEVLGSTLPNIVEQVFVITHDDALRQITGASIYQFERDKAAHGFTSVSGV
jgi:DNA repair exonuclease SbcCD ATPase subunit